MKRVGIVGCGNWGCTVANLVATGIDACEFTSEVEVYVHETEVECDGVTMKLSEAIMKKRQNPVFLPGIRIRDEIVAITDTKRISEWDVVIICIPCKYLHMLSDVKFKSDAILVSLTKGLVLHQDTLLTPSMYIHEISGKTCSSLQGANIASEVARGVLSECVLSSSSSQDREILCRLFVKSRFKVLNIEYDPCIEVYGAVKNIIALGYGILEGLGGHVGENTKAFYFGRGCREIQKFVEVLGYTGNHFFESCGVGEVFVSCLHGRNAHAGKEIAMQFCIGKEDYRCDFSTWRQQHMQGVETVAVVYEYLAAKNLSAKFDLITIIYQILYHNADPQELYIYLEKN